MTCLLYGIVRARQDREPPRVTGVGGEAVSVVSGRELAAVASRIALAGLSPDLECLLGYERVVAALHGMETMIPMRFGCVLETEAEVARFLDGHCRRYQELLDALDGYTEMGIRVIVPPPTTDAPATCHLSPITAPSGSAYLAARREHYRAEQRVSTLEESIAGQIHAGLSGLYKCAKRESSLRAQCQLLSLHFLVPRDAVNSFRLAFRHLHRDGRTALLLSGPWPPYNFALPEEWESSAPSHGGADKGPCDAQGFTW